MATLPNAIPTMAGFQDWLYNVVGIPVEWLPIDSSVLTYAYDAALTIVNPIFGCVPGSIYQIMVYNLATHYVMFWAPDVTTSPPYPYKTIDGVDYGYFQWQRKQNNMNGFTTGIVQSASDNGTSTSMVVPDQAKNLTMSQLGLTTTPWGRTYLGLAQDWNTAWGIS